jgi:hypothetical protein
MRRWIAVGLLLGASSACGNPQKQLAEGDEPIAALTATVLSRRYDAEFWKGQAHAQTTVWSIALQYCLTEHRRKLREHPTCRPVLVTAVELAKAASQRTTSSPPSQRN